jgi:hypothetical protein
MNSHISSFDALLKLTTMQKFLFLAACTTVLLSSCSRSYFYKPIHIPENQQTITYQNGIQCLSHKQDGITVSAHLIKAGSSDVQLMLSIYNDSDSIVDFHPDGVAVKGFNKQGAGKTLKVMSARDVVRRRNKRTAIAVGALVATVTAIAVADEHHDRKNGNGNQDNRLAYDPFWYWIPPPTTVLMLPPQSAGVVQSRDGILRAHTLQPGEELRGKIIIQRPSEYTETMEIRIPIDGREEFFSFSGRERLW